MRLPLLTALALTLFSLATSAPIAVAIPAPALSARTPDAFQCPEGCPVGKRDSGPVGPAWKRGAEAEYESPVGINKRIAVPEYESPVGINKREAVAGETGPVGKL
ncbi:hypothetical protein MMC34_002466 [Xylographa carneopallida]|nr:hypothetical protein [Xylographa carneopallida]